MTDQELAELDLAVAKIEGMQEPAITVSALYILPPEPGRCRIRRFGGPEIELYEPTRDRDLAMRLLEKYDLSLSRRRRGGASPSLKWHAWIKNKVHKAEGETPCIAICRVVVALKGVPA